MANFEALPKDPHNSFLKIVVDPVDNVFRGHPRPLDVATVRRGAGVRRVELAQETHKFTKYFCAKGSVRGQGAVCVRVRLDASRADDDHNDALLVKDTWVEHSSSVTEPEIFLIPKGCKSKDVWRFIAGCVEFHQAMNSEMGEKTGDYKTCVFRNPLLVVETLDWHRIVVPRPYKEPNMMELLFAISDIQNSFIESEGNGVTQRDIILGVDGLALVEEQKYRKGLIIDYNGSEDCHRSGRRLRNGTVTFMACDLLRNAVEHSVVQDAESLAYVLIWIALTQAGPRGMKRDLAAIHEYRRSTHRNWCSSRVIALSSRRELSSAKRYRMINKFAFRDCILGQMHRYFRPLEPCFRYLRYALFLSEPSPQKCAAENCEELYDPDYRDRMIRRENMKVIQGIEKAFARRIERLLKVQNTEAEA